MNTLTEQQILNELRELDPFSQQELLDFLAFLRGRQQSGRKSDSTSFEHSRLAKPFPLTHVEDGIGCVGYQGPRKSLVEMEQGIAEEARRQWQQKSCA